MCISVLCTILPLARIISAQPIVSERAKYMTFMKCLYTVSVPGSKIIMVSFVNGQKSHQKDTSKTVHVFDLKRGWLTEPDSNSRPIGTS